MKFHLVTLLISLTIIFCLSQVCFAIQNTEKQSLEIEQLREKAFELSQQWERESISKSISLYLKLFELSECYNIPQKSSYLREAGKLELILGNVKEALSLLQKSLKVERKSPNIDGTAETLSQLSYVYSTLGNYAESNRVLEELSKILSKIEKTKSKAEVYYYLGETYFARQDIPKFLDYYSRSLELYKQLNDRYGEAKTLWAMAYGHLGNDDLQNGLASAREALQKWEQLGNKRGITLSMVAVGLAYFRLGKSTDALTHFNQANQEFPRDIDTIEKGILLNNIGRVYESLGDCNEAISNFKKAVAIFNEEQNLSFAIGNLAGLGSISYKCGYKDDAFKYLQQSLEIAKKTRSSHEIMYIYTEIASIYSKENLFSKSEFNYKKALETDKSNEYKFDKSRALSGLGELYLKSNKTQSALENYLSSLEIATSIKDRFSTAETLFKLAKLYSSENYQEKAIEHAKKSIEITENLYMEVLNSKLKQTYLSNVYDRYELFINLSMNLHKKMPDGNYAVEALQGAEKSRARVMLENLSLSEANFTKDADPKAVKREKEIRVLLNAKADKLTDLLSQNAEKNETDKISGEINELENELENIKAQLKQQSPIYSAIKNPAPFDVGEFQRNVLDENSLLLEFSLGEDESYLWLVGKNEISSYVLPPREEIESKIEKLRGLLKANELKTDESVEDLQKRIREAETEYQSVANELSNLLFGQIADKLGEKRLIIVPDGELHYFPVAALPQPNSATDEPILLTNETIYEPSAQTLTIFAKSQKQSAPTAKSLLVFSDPIFKSDDARFSADNKPAENSNGETAQTDKFRFVESLNNLPRLAASKDESETIINIVGANGADNFSGFAATREKLLNLKTADYKIIHFATHGLTDEKRPELSGIVLSRFDEKGRKLDEFFRIQDIYGLNLNADLVVLSACETGIGKEVRGEGLMSLNNAFLQTGAKSVMASLWKVEDGATLELMKNFYGAMANENLTPSESLRQAQIKLRENSRYKSPFYWAAFTVQGDFRNVPKISNGFGFWVYLLPIVPLALIGFYVHRRRKIYSIAKP